MKIEPGQQIRAKDGLLLVVLKHLGSGGQGDVYEVELEGKLYALKVYHKPRTPDEVQRASEQREVLSSELMRRDPPDPRFLWPKHYVDDIDRSFGYLMDLRSPRYRSFERLVAGTLTPSPDYRVLATAAIGLAESFRQLHLAGLVFKDINLGGGFLDPVTGDVLLCDCDNVRVNGTPGTILFMPFGAPEVVVGRASCSQDTDDHSLAVMLFYMFVRDHPLEGEREASLNTFNEMARKRLYGEEPLFIFDPHSRDNRPVPGIHVAAIANWPRLPVMVQKAFIRVFTEGLFRPDRRLKDGEWIDVFSRFRDALFACTHCGRETVYDIYSIRAGRLLRCVWCSSTLSAPPRIRIGNEVVVLSPRSCLYPHHVGKVRDFSRPVAELARHPRDPVRWGLKNTSGEKWTYLGDGGVVRDIPPGSSVSIRDGLELNFGSATGVIRA